MTEHFIIGLLLVIYATGVAASLVEFYEQLRADQTPSAVELAARVPSWFMIVVNLIMGLTWPLVITWAQVRRSWR